jgi:hypothetical protein
MDKNRRSKNELEFGSWIEKKDGGRIYFFEIMGKVGWKAKYCKEVNAEEITTKFWQEIYDDQNILREIHEKYPIDKGHQQV